MRQVRDYIKTRGYSLVSGLLNSLYPSTCPLCSRQSDSYTHSPVCLDCWKTIEKYSGPSCSVCATPLVSEYSTVCGDCTKEAPPFIVVLNYGIYSNVLAESMNQFKFYGIKRMARPLGRLLLELDIPQADGIAPVPLTKKGLMMRGFNQSALLAKVLSKGLKIPLYLDLLYKKRETLPQVGLSAKERMKNLKGAFGVRGMTDNLRLILFDDVMTTGATARECSTALIKAGAKEVIVITLARSGMI